MGVYSRAGTRRLGWSVLAPASRAQYTPRPRVARPSPRQALVRLTRLSSLWARGELRSSSYTGDRRAKMF